MKVKFLCDCEDKNTKDFYPAESVREFDDERALEIIATGHAEEFVEVVEEVKEELTAEMALENGMVVNLHELTKDKLVEIAKKQGVATKGTKDELIERLLASQE